MSRHLCISRSFIFILFWSLKSFLSFFKYFVLLLPTDPIPSLFDIAFIVVKLTIVWLIINDLRHEHAIISIG